MEELRERLEELAQDFRDHLADSKQVTGVLEKLVLAVDEAIIGLSEEDLIPPAIKVLGYYRNNNVAEGGFHHRARVDDVTTWDRVRMTYDDGCQDEYDLTTFRANFTLEVPPCPK